MPISNAFNASPSPKAPASLPESVDTDDLKSKLVDLVKEWPTLPLPGQGDTLGRWRRLAQVATCDLALAKLFEAHADAMAILAELDPSDEIRSRLEENANGENTPIWGVWAAEPPDARLFCRPGPQGSLLLEGRKAWCSGAAWVSHALVTCWQQDGLPWLAAVAMQSPGVEITREGWHAVGMYATASTDVVFDQVQAVAVGAPGAYTLRPGFWQGGAGIAACWYGGALPLAEAVYRRMVRRFEPHELSHLGRIDVALRSVRALLHETAAWIDANPQADAMAEALRLRCAAESAALTVLGRAGRALGAGPLCRDAALAQRYADLPIFLRQSHAERDLEALGEQVATHAGNTEWLP